MRSFKRFDSRGFTLIELMIVVAIVGVLAALAIYGVKRYLTNAKTAEVKTAVGRMAKDARMSFDGDRSSGNILAPGASAAIANNLCLSATKSVPDDKAKIAGKKYQSDPAIDKDWNLDSATPGVGFGCLKFSLTDPQYFMYSYKSSAVAAGTKEDDTFDAIGEGDLNGDGVLSSFKLSGKIKGGTVLMSPTFIEANPDE